MVLKFNDRVKPQEIWIAQPQEETNMATQVKVFITDDVYWTLDADNGFRTM